MGRPRQEESRCPRCCGGSFPWAPPCSRWPGPRHAAGPDVRPTPTRPWATWRDSAPRCVAPFPPSNPIGNVVPRDPPALERRVRQHRAPVVRGDPQTAATPREQPLAGRAQRVGRAGWSSPRSPRSHRRASGPGAYCALCFGGAPSRSVHRVVARSDLQHHRRGRGGAARGDHRHHDLSRDRRSRHDDHPRGGRAAKPPHGLRGACRMGGSQPCRTSPRAALRR